jgi:hypothetical protein
VSSIASDPPVSAPPRTFLSLAVQITEEDIAKGEPAHSGRCPAALAIQRALDAFGPDMGTIAVTAGLVCWRRPSPETWGQIACVAHADPPRALGQFVVRLDSHAPVTPLDVELDFYPLPREGDPPILPRFR